MSERRRVADEFLEQRKEISKKLNTFDFEVRKTKQELVNKAGQLLNQFELHDKKYRELKVQYDLLEKEIKDKQETK